MSDKATWHLCGYIEKFLIFDRPDPETVERFRKYAKIIRIMSGITQRELCQYLRKDNGYVSRVELGKDTYTTEDILAINDKVIGKMFNSPEQREAVLRFFANYIWLDNVWDAKLESLIKLAEYSETVKDKIMRTNLQKEIKRIGAKIE